MIREVIEEERMSSRKGNERKDGSESSQSESGDFDENITLSE